MFSVSSIRPQIPHVCIPCIIYSITLWYPQFTPSRSRHGTQVYYSGMGQSRMYVMPYSHTAAYTAIALPKGTFWSHSRNVTAAAVSVYQPIIAAVAATLSTCHINIHSRCCSCAQRSAEATNIGTHTVAISITSRKTSTHRPVLHRTFLLRLPIYF